MKIDTSKLTPTKAQQIEAIASDIDFDIKVTRELGEILDGITVKLEHIESRRLMTRIMEQHEADLARGIVRDDENYRRRIATLKKKMAGQPVWQCQHTIGSDLLRAVSSVVHNNEALRLQLGNLVSDALTKEFGVEMNIDRSFILLGVLIEAEFDTWQEARQWYETQRELRVQRRRIVETIDTVVADFVKTLGIISRLRVRYSSWINPGLTATVVRWFFTDLPLFVGHCLKKLKATFSKPVDNTSSKA